MSRERWSKLFRKARKIAGASHESTATGSAKPITGPRPRLLVVFQHVGWSSVDHRDRSVLRFFAGDVEYVRANGQMRIWIGSASWDVTRDGSLMFRPEARTHRLGDRWAHVGDLDTVREQLTRRKQWDEVSVLFPVTAAREAA